MPQPRLRAVLALLVVLAFALRLTFVAIDSHPYRQAADAARQGGVARAILDGGKWGMEDRGVHVIEQQDKRHELIDFSEPWILRGPHKYTPLVLHTQGVGIILAGVWKLTGDRDYIYLALLEVMLAALATLLVFWIGRTLYSERAGLIAAGLYALFVPLAEFSRYILYDTWAVLATIAITALVVRATVAERPMRWVVAAGIATGLSVNFRFQLVLLVPVLAVALIPKLGWRRSLAGGAIATAIAIVLFSPWTIRNAIVYDAFVPVHTGNGQVMWQGFGDRPNNPFGAVDDDAITYQQVRKERPDLVYATPAYDRYLQGKAFDAIKQRPLWYAGLVAERVVRATIASKNTNWVGGKRQRAFLDRKEGVLPWVLHHPALAALLAFAGLMQPLLVVAALLALALTWRDRWRTHLLPLGVIAATLLTPVLLNNTWRYIAPSIFAWMLLAAAGADRLLARRTPQQPAPAAAQA